VEVRGDLRCPTTRRKARYLRGGWPLLRQLAVNRPVVNLARLSQHVPAAVDLEYAYRSDGHFESSREVPGRCVNYDLVPQTAGLDWRPPRKDSGLLKSPPPEELKKIVEFPVRSMTRMGPLLITC